MGVSNFTLACEAHILTSNFRLGPEGIIRFTFPVDTLREEHASRFVERKVARDQQNAAEALQAWDQRKRRSARNRR